MSIKYMDRTDSGVQQSIHEKLEYYRDNGLLNSISIAGSDNPLVEVEYKGKQSNVILTPQGESTLKIFGE
jgi:hypothetical protein